METIAGEVRLMMRDALSIEKLAALGDTLAVQVRLNQLCEHDPELAPELKAIGDHAAEAIEAVTRAMKFVQARMDAR